MTDSHVKCLFGSGAGFPGLVLAIMGAPEVHLIESDTRKCAFLREVARETGLRLGGAVRVHRRRIEEMEPFPADVVTARACADLDQLLFHAEPFLQQSSICLFLKGMQVDEELTIVKKRWKIDIERVPSVSDPSGTILRLGHIHRNADFRQDR